MFFEREAFSFNLIDIFELRQNGVNIFNSGRNFNALSFRFRSDALLKTKTNEYRMGDNYVSYFPARLDYDRQASVDELIVVHFDTTNYRTRDIEFFLPREPEVLAGLFREILECWNKKEIGYYFKCSALLYEIFAECYRQNYRQEVRDSKISRSVEYMLKHYSNCDLTIKEIADQSYISEVYFRKLFKEGYGTSPRKYLVDLRIQHAVGLISTGYYSLKEVAYMSGYNDYKYFSVEFKKHKGLSPSEYLYNYEHEQG